APRGDKRRVGGLVRQAKTLQSGRESNQRNTCSAEWSRKKCHSHTSPRRALARRRGGGSGAQAEGAGDRVGVKFDCNENRAAAHPTPARKSAPTLPFRRARARQGRVEGSSVHPIRMFASRTTRPQRSVSAATNARNSSGVFSR